MQELRRTFYDYLVKWKMSKGTECLLVKGARQIGKTFIIRKSGTIFTRMSAIRRDLNIVPGRTLLFLDELQDCPNARTAFKFLAEDGRCDVVATGSLLGIKYKYRKRRERMEPRSIPVGYERHATMYSLSFEEYLSLNEIKTDSVSMIRDKNKIVREFENYFYNGGLPELHYAKVAEKRMWLSNLYNKIYFGDLVFRYKIRNERAVKLLIKKIAESVKQPTSYTRLSNIVSSCGSKVKPDTVADYLNYAEEAWLIFHVENFSQNFPNVIP